MIPLAAQVRAKSAGAGEVQDFEKYAPRIERLVPYLTEDDKDMLGALYAGAESHGATSREMKKIDRLARDLV